ncbi:MAG: M15 family metallopeptidase [Cellulosilyticaceae bacterium]
MVNQCRDLNELHPKVKQLAEALIAECKKQGLNIGISETYRTKERQDYLYAQGRTRPGNIVTHVSGRDMRSYHQWRLAFDVYNDVKGNEYDTKVLRKVGEIGKKLGLEWGGSWSGFQDTPHFQYTFGLSIKELKSGKKPPEQAEKAQPPKFDLQVEYQKAIEALFDFGIISTKDAWLPEPSLKYTPALILKLGERIVGAKDYNLVIELFAKNSMITDVTIWRDEKYNSTQVKWLLLKIVKYL